MMTREELASALEMLPVNDPDWRWDLPLTDIVTAARERLAQLEGNDLVIPRDADGNWPMALLDEIEEQGDTNPWVVQSAIECWLEGTE